MVPYGTHLLIEYFCVECCGHYVHIYYTILPFKAIEQRKEKGDIPINNHHSFLGGENGVTKSRIYSRPTLPQSMKVLKIGNPSNICMGRFLWLNS